MIVQALETDDLVIRAVEAVDHDASVDRLYEDDSHGVLVLWAHCGRSTVFVLSMFTVSTKHV